MIISKFFRALFFTATLLSIYQTSYADPPLPTPVGRVAWVKGTLKAVMPSKEERSLQKLSVIYLHDTLITDDKSLAQIVFTDDTLMTFKSGSKFSIDDYSYNPKKKSGSVGKSVMNLLEGGFRTITGLIEKRNPNDYQINTPVATIGARGTDYAVYIDKKTGTLNIGYYAGQPCVRNLKREVCLNQDNKYAVVAPNQAPQLVSVEPDGFKEQLPIEPFKIQPFAPVGNSNGGGTVSSFCITG